MQETNKKWDTNYEWKAVLLLALGFGLVGMDRFVIATLWPAMSRDLGLAPQLIGTLAGYTALAWGVFSIIFGRLADRWGHRKILIISVIGFSLTGGFSGMAQGLVFLVVIRTLMGVMEGAYTPTSVTAVAVASKPERRGLNQGMQQSLIALGGLALAPIIASQLLAAGFSWRIIFVMIAAPGFIIAILLYFVMREPEDTQGAALLGVKRDSTQSWGETIKGLGGPLKSYNIVVGMICLLCTMAGLFVLGAMIPVYLDGHLGIGVAEMGFITAAIGFGGFAGQFTWPGISDKIGRKPTAIMGFVFATLACWWFSEIESGTMALFIPLFITSYFLLGNIALITGPIATEAAPVGMVGASIGMVIGVGEIFGGGVAPMIAGAVAGTYGLGAVVYVALAGVALGIIPSFLLKETAPVKLATLKKQVTEKVKHAVEESGPVA